MSMAEGKHTRGPWTAKWIRPDLDKGHNFNPRCSIVADSPAGRIRLADIPIAEIPDPISEEYEANARLIAAAPDLLVAARYTLDMLWQTAGSETVSSRLAGMGGAYAEKLLGDAVAKAEGRDS